MLGALNTKNDFLRYMTVKMLVDYIHLSDSQIYKLINRRQIPYFKLGRAVRFDRVEIDQWMKNGGYMNDDIPKLPEI